MAVLEDYINSLPADKQEDAARKIAGMSEAEKKNILSVAHRNADINALPPDQQEAAARKRIEDEQKIADQRVSESSNNSFPKNNPFKNKVVGTYNGKPVYQNSKWKQYYFTGKGWAVFVPTGKLETATPPSPFEQSKRLMDSAKQTWDKLKAWTNTWTWTVAPTWTWTLSKDGAFTIWAWWHEVPNPEEWTWKVTYPEIQNVWTGQIQFNTQWQDREVWLTKDNKKVYQNPKGEPYYTTPDWWKVTVPRTDFQPNSELSGAKQTQTGSWTILPPWYVTNNNRRDNLLWLVSTYNKNKPNNFKSQILNFS